MSRPLNGPSELNSLDSNEVSAVNAVAASELDSPFGTSESTLKVSHTKQRVIIYGALLTFTIFALNDYRLRASWEQHSHVLFSTLTHSKGLPQDDSDAVALKMMQEGDGVDSWLEDLGYSLDESRSGVKVRVFTKSSGLRSYWLVVDYHAGGSSESPFLTTLNVTQQSHYFWTPKPAAIENAAPSSAVQAEGEGRDVVPSDSAMMQGGGSRQRRNFSPEARFKEMDTNGDETLTDDELSDRLRDNLERFDSNGDMEVTKQEFMDAMEAILSAARESRSSNNSGQGGAGGPGQRGVSGTGGGLYDVPDDPGETGEEDPNRLPES